MITIQLILIGLLAGGCLVYFARLRSKLWDRILVLALAATGVLFVARPGLTMEVANRVGVGRGVDLLFYLSTVGFGFVILLLFSQIRELEAKMTDMARAIALITADDRSVRASSVTRPTPDYSSPTDSPV